MLCQACGKKRATFHTIQTVNGLCSELHLCDECKAKLAYDESAFVSGKSPFSVFFGEDPAPRHKCSKCGMTEEQFVSSGYLGCERCYTEFEKSILPRVAKIQQGTVHIGKRPTTESETPESEYERLKIELQKAVDIEDYERAARIQKRMRDIREKS